VCFTDAVFDSDKNVVFIITEFLNDYVDLIQFVKETKDMPMSKKVKPTVKVFHECINALKKLHADGFAHLDIKHNNIMINRKSLNIKIIDFGRACSDDAKVDCFVMAHHDIMNYHYLAPEYRKISSKIKITYTNFRKHISHMKAFAMDIYSMGFMLLSLTHMIFKFEMDVAKTFLKACEIDVDTMMNKDPTKRTLKFTKSIAKSITKSIIKPASGAKRQRNNTFKKSPKPFTPITQLVDEIEVPGSYETI
jgi:serine/threonine protein kinase